jgi:hypothetical protein
MMTHSYLKQMCKGVLLHKQLVSVLSDLENKYLELLRAKTWKGVGINVKHKTSAYNVQDDTLSYNKYRTYVINAGKNALPFAKWVEFATCHHVVGHL